MTTLSYLHDVSYHKRIARPDLVHHLLGNGRLQVVAQVTENLAARNALVVHIMNPERFAGRHKQDSFTFHQQLGPEYTMVGLSYEGSFFLPHPRQTACDLRYALEFADGLPRFCATYPLDFTFEGRRQKTPFNVDEEWFCPPQKAALVRRLEVQNRRGLEAAAATLLAFLTPNQSLFPEAHYVSGEDVAVAGHFDGGDEFLALAAFSPADGHHVSPFPIPFQTVGSGRLQDAGPSCDDDVYVQPEGSYTNYPLLPISPHVGPVMALQFDLGPLAPGESRSVELIYAYWHEEGQLLTQISELREQGSAALRAAARTYWEECNSLNTSDIQVDNLFAAARAGLRAAVSAAGHMNAGIWGYGAEWVRDSSLACVGAVLSGQFAMANRMLRHILEEMVSPLGLAFGEGQFYELKRAELDQNGELLHALWIYWVHSRDESLVHEQWDKIQALAEFPLRPEFWVQEAGMVRSERDVRERDLERHGLLPGYELAHQMWVSMGLRRAADMARLLGEDGLARRWDEYGRRIWDSALHHPQFRLVENNYLMKRRTLQGEFQRTTTMRPYVHRPTEEPLTKMYPRCLNRSGALEPDAFEAWPIAHGLVDAQSELARRTLIRMEQLWNQEWDFGGYPLHNVDSEPTKLGSWPMTLYIITQAAVEAGDMATVRRNLRWIMNTKDGRGYMWWEYRDAQPELQIDHGVTPWLIYGEPLFLLVHNMLGYRPGPQSLTIRPRLLPEWVEVKARMRHGISWVDLCIHNRGARLARATVNGCAWSRISDDALEMALPDGDVEVVIWLEKEK